MLTRGMRGFSSRNRVYGGDKGSRVYMRLVGARRVLSSTQTHSSYLASATLTKDDYLTISDGPLLQACTSCRSCRTRLLSNRRSECSDTCTASWRDLQPHLHPTQNAVGFAWVHRKIEHDFSSASDAQDTMDSEPLPDYLVSRNPRCTQWGRTRGRGHGTGRSGFGRRCRVVLQHRHTRYQVQRFGRPAICMQKMIPILLIS